MKSPLSPLPSPFYYKRNAKLLHNPQTNAEITLKKKKPKPSTNLELIAGEWLVLVLQVEDGVDDSGEAASDEWAHPVDPVTGEVAGGDCGSEGAGGVHGSTGEWAGGQDVGTDDETDGYGSDGAQCTLLGVHSGGVDGVDEGEGDDDLEHDSLDRSDSGSDTVDRDGLNF